MSTAREIDRALKRGAKRDKKRQPGMKVSGKGVFALAKIIRKAK